ncbi:MAG: BON domain-containing protein [Gemmatimonadaceae bacterium]
MTLTKQPRAFAILSTLCLALAACGRSDPQIYAEANKVNEGQSTSIEVKDGVVTISGQFANDSAKAAVETALKAVKGVKSVVDNATIARPVLSPDELLKAGVLAVLKDVPTLQVDVTDGVVTLTGEVQKTALPGILQALSELNPKKINNKAIVKR